MKARGLVAAGAAVLLLALGAGCIIIPTPEHDSGRARSNLNKESPSQIQPGISTMADVMLSLGEPDAVSSDERRLVYRSEKIIAYWAAGGGYSGGIGALTKDRYLLIELDEAGVVTKLDSSATWLVSTSPERLLRAGEAGTRPPNGEAIRFSATAVWYPHCDGLNFSKAGSPAGSGQFVLTATALEFRDSRQFGNAEPALVLPYEALNGCRIARFGFGRFLVVRTKSDAAHTFSLSHVQGVNQGEDALDAVHRFLEASIGR
jgi:hypothetical protein